MYTQLSEKKAKLHIILIGIFYVISGIFELGVGVTQAEGVSSGVFFLLDMYCNYLAILGGGTFLVGILILFRINFVRLIVIALAWWNLFTAPIIYIWWNIYSILIKKFSVVNPTLPVFIYTITIILIYTLIRIYIIRTLSIKKAGYLFLKKKL